MQTVYCRTCHAAFTRRAQGNTTWYFVYRDATTGEPVTHCPTCGGVLDINTTQEEVREDESTIDSR